MGADIEIPKFKITKDGPMMGWQYAKPTPFGEANKAFGQQREVSAKKSISTSGAIDSSMDKYAPLPSTHRPPPPGCIAAHTHTRRRGRSRRLIHSQQTKHVRFHCSGRVLFCIDPPSPLVLK